MTIASEIARLQGVKSDILGAIAEKKVDVPTGAMLADAPELIRSIKSGINVKIGQGVYPAVKIGNQLWLARNLDEELGTLGVDEWYYNGRSEKTRINSTTTLSGTGATTMSTQLYDWNDGRTSSARNSVTIHSRNINISFDYTLSEEYTSGGPSLYINGHLEDGTYDSGAWCGGFTLTGTSGSKTVNMTIADRLVDMDSLRFSGLGGRTYSFTNIRISYGSSDCGANAITVPQALANEATAKANNYGRLYTFDTILNNISKLGLTKWRWATRADFNNLITIDPTGIKFRDKSFGNGSNDYGLSILPSGERNGDSGTFGSGRFVCWCNETSTKYLAVCNISSFVTNTISLRTHGNSLRLVMDLNEDGTIPDSNIVIEEPATTAEPLALASEPIVEEE